MFNSQKKMERDKKQRSAAESYKQKRKKCLWDLGLCILWLIILVMNIVSKAEMFLIIMDAICVICWGLSSLIGFMSLKKEDNDEK